MPLQVINGVPVDFPHAPYDCQVTFMERVLECLDKRTNALLESPTGTGKTLALLCSTLAWQQERRRKSAYGGALALSTDQSLIAPKGGPSNQPGGGQGGQTIIYATRTHAQLAQVVRELKSTTYTPRVAILGSREQFCVHPEVRQYTGSLQNRKCGSLTSDHRCQYKNNLASFHSQNVGMATGVLDIEDLLAVGKRETVCPYYLMRGATDHADLILMPYNYLMDAESRKPYEMRWKDSIIIFDEAHNLEGVAADSLSVEISSSLLSGCVAEVDRSLLRIQREGEAPSSSAASAGPGRRVLASKADLVLVKKLLLDLEDQIFAVEVTPASSSSGFGRGAGGGDQRPSGLGGKDLDPLRVHELFERAGLELGTYESVVKRLQRAIDRLMDEAGVLEKNFTSSLEAFLKVIKVIFRLGDFEAVKASLPYYSGYIKQEPAKPRSSSSSTTTITAPASGKTTRTLCYWCFLPGLAMEQLAKLEVRSIILTSGTLNPLDSFASELRIPFPIRLENQHVIDSSQVLVGVMGTGVGGHLLSSSYQRRNEKEYHDELGNTIIQLCTIIPDGVLIFFASYGLMEGCVKTWQQSGAWRRLLAGKLALVEPRESSQLKACIASFDNAIATGRGAVLLAVCRGKVSEGVDFSDARARAVIITGIPFPPARDPKVELKRKHLDKPSYLRASIDAQRLKGMEWYAQQASRAVNQAVGRVIRHRHDYGAILLLDDRFAQEQQKQGMSLWLRPHIQVWSSYREGSAKLQEFFRRSSGGGRGGSEEGGGAAGVRVGAGARAPRSLMLEDAASLREAVVVGAELEEDADYVDPKAIKAVVRPDEGASAASIEKFKEFQAAIKRAQQEQEEKEAAALRRAGTLPEQPEKPPSLSNALLRSSSTGARGSGSSSGGGGGSSSGKKKRRLSGIARAYGPLPSSQTLSERLGFSNSSSQALSQRSLADSAASVGSKRPRPLGLQGSISKGVDVVGPVPSSALAAARRAGPDSAKENRSAAATGSVRGGGAVATKPVEGGGEEEEEVAGGVMTAEELGGLLKRARQGPMPPDRYELLKDKVKALLGNRAAGTVREFQAWAPSAVGLFIEAGAQADFLQRLSSSYLPKAMQSAFQAMVTVRLGGKAPPHSTRVTAGKDKAAAGAARGPQAAAPSPSAASCGERADGTSVAGSNADGTKKRPPSSATPGAILSKRAQQQVAAAASKKTGGLTTAMPSSVKDGSSSSRDVPLSQQLSRRELEVYDRMRDVTDPGSGRLVASTGEDLLQRVPKRQCNICYTQKSIILMSPCRHLACQDCWEKHLSTKQFCTYNCAPVMLKELKLVVKKNGSDRSAGLR